MDENPSPQQQKLRNVTIIERESQAKLDKLGVGFII